MPTLTDIAADIRKHSPGALPKSFDTSLPPPLDGRCWIVDANLNTIPECPDDIAEAVLIAAMVVDGRVSRTPSYNPDGWVSYRMFARDSVRIFNDSDHGGPLGACHAAWRWVKGLY